MFGLLNVNKPAGVTSRDVVNRVQRLVRPAKVDHAGTLDPLATGVLVIGIGPATRLVEYVQRMPKTYRGTFLLGRTSDTEDIEGEVWELIDPPRPSADAIRAALQRFVGTIDQRPPAYSALKVQGERAYDRARRGDAVDLAARPVEIHSLELVAYAYPQFTLLVRCGSGTYIRSLGRDLAQSLGTGAVMSALVREAVGPFSLDSALDCEALTAGTIESGLLSPILALGDLPQIKVNDSEVRRLLQGQTIADRWNYAVPEMAAISERSELIAVVVRINDRELRTGKGFG